MQKCVSTRAAKMSVGNKTVKKTSERRVYQLKVTLRDISPPIWRRIQVAGDYTLDQLHRVLPMAMGWENYHEYEFHVAGRKYRLPDPDESDVLDAKRVRIRDVLSARGSEFLYIYDFGDYWRHDLHLEAILAPEPDAAYPRCLDGARSCPPEDVGGSGGYQEYLEAVADPKHKAHSEMIRWRGAFDPEVFSSGTFNQRSQKTFRPVPKRHRPKTATPQELRRAVSLLPIPGPLERIRVTPNETVPLKLTAHEYELIRARGSDGYSLTDRLNVLPKSGEGRILQCTLRGLDELACDVAFEASQAKSKRRRNELQLLFHKIRGTLDDYTDKG